MTEDEIKEIIGIRKTPAGKPAEPKKEGDPKSASAPKPEKPARGRLYDILNNSDRF